MNPEVREIAIKANQEIALRDKKIKERDYVINNLKAQINSLNDENERLKIKLSEKDSEIDRLCKIINDMECELSEYKDFKEKIYKKAAKDFMNLLEPIQYMLGYENAVKKGHSFSEDEISYSYNSMIIKPLQKAECSDKYLKLLATFEKMIERYTSDKTAFMKIMFPMYCDLIRQIKSFLAKESDIDNCVLNIKEIFAKYNVNVVFYEDATAHIKKIYFNEGNQYNIPVPILIIDGKYENMFSEPGIYREY